MKNIQEHNEILACIKGADSPSPVIGLCGGFKYINDRFIDDHYYMYYTITDCIKSLVENDDIELNKFTCYLRPDEYLKYYIEKDLFNSIGINFKMSFQIDNIREQQDKQYKTIAVIFSDEGVASAFDEDDNYIGSKFLRCNHCIEIQL